jgi:hypothetical protein
MKKLISFVAGPVAAALLCVASVSPSYAQTTAFVSGGGSDANPCTVTAPCRSIGHASGLAGTGGTVTCVDAGPYTESITVDYLTLDCPGVVYTTRNNFAVTVPDGGDVVTFRNVIFDGIAGGDGAVHITGGGKVVFENCTVQNFTAGQGIGVLVQPGIHPAQVLITDSVFFNNGAAGAGAGVFVSPNNPGPTNVVIERTQFTGNTYGIFATAGSSLIEVNNSTIAESAIDGIWALNSGGPITSIVLDHSASVQNGANGINAQGPGAYVSLRDSTVAWNGTGLTMAGGSILTYQNNLIAGNLSPGATPVSYSLQ